MEKPKWIPVAVVALVLVAIVGLVVLMGKKPVAPVGQEIYTENVPSSMPSPYPDWTYFRNGYGIKVPPDWKNTSDTGGTAVLEPGMKVGNIAKISITVLSDAKASPEQRFTTQIELDEWYEVSGRVQGDIQKMGIDTKVDGQKAVMLWDGSRAEDPWTIIVWTRKDNINLYITIKGTGPYALVEGSVVNDEGNYTQEDQRAIDFLVSSFKFQAPPSDGKDGK